MTQLILPGAVEIHHARTDGDACYDYAVAEICRLLQKINIVTRIAVEPELGKLFRLFVGLPGALMPAIAPLRSGLFPDAYSLEISAKGVLIASATAKGVLNGIYDLAGKLGFAFLMPGENGEWVPGTVHSLAIGRAVSKPRFRHRGVFYGGLTHDFSAADWLQFYAKLRFNAVCFHGPEIEDKGLLQRLGLRAETGGHGYRELLPRKLFARKPDLFRMEQPEDFGGKRVDDFNSCAVNPEARRIMGGNFRKQVRQTADEGFYALHLWPDDLPGGGWCLCPDCRSLAPSDQAMLAMRNLAGVVREEKVPMRVPMIAYHDTMQPAGNVPPSKETFLLFAPRERCYGHRLDDPKCARNRFYMSALTGWMAKFKGIGDAHTFEYYFDQILFRGLHPYLPDVIAGDMSVYEQQGIESHMALHIAGPAVAPDWNMLFFAGNLWDANLLTKDFNASFPLTFCSGAAVTAWTDYLDARARIYTKAMCMCDHEINVYLDYRWLPENTKPFGRKMVKIYGQCSTELAHAADRLEHAISSKGSAPLRKLAAAEVARARFEAAELEVMSHQQDSVNQAADYLVTGNPSALRAAIAAGENVIRVFKSARERAKKAHISEKSWYFRNINRWLSNETKSKIKRWKKAI